MRIELSFLFDLYEIRIDNNYKFLLGGVITSMYVNDIRLDYECEFFSQKLDEFWIDKIYDDWKQINIKDFNCLDLGYRYGYSTFEFECEKFDLSKLSIPIIHISNDTNYKFDMYLYMYKLIYYDGKPYYRVKDYRSRIFDKCSSYKNLWRKSL